MGSWLRVAVIVAAMSAGCGGNPTAPDPTIDDLRRAPLTVTVDGASVPLEASLWRNLMPSIPPAGSPLLAALRLSGSTSASIDRMWVLRGDETWETTPERLAGTSEWTARDGPQWTPGTRVDVVARVRSMAGRAHLVRAADQVVEAAY